MANFVVPGAREKLTEVEPLASVTAAKIEIRFLLGLVAVPVAAAILYGAA